MSTSKKCSANAEPRPLTPHSSLEHPGLALAMFCFERFDFLRVNQREPDLVQPVQHAILGERIDVELETFPTRRGYGLLLEVHRQLVAFFPMHFAKQAIDDLLVEPDHQQAVLEAVVVENVGEARRNYRLEARLQQCPRGVLAR